MHPHVEFPDFKVREVLVMANLNLDKCNAWFAAKSFTVVPDVEFKPLFA